MLLICKFVRSTFSTYLLCLLFVNVCHFSYTQTEEKISFLEGKINEFFFTDTDSSYYYHQILENIYQDNKEHESYVWVMLSHAKSAAFNFDYNEYKSVLDELNLYTSSNKSEINELSTANLIWQYIELYTGIYYYQTVNYSQAKPIFISIIAALESLPEDELTWTNYPLLSQAYKFLAAIENSEGKFKYAKEIYEQNLRINQSNFPNYKEDFYNIYFLLGKTYQLDKEFKESNKYLLPSLAYNRSLQSNINRLVTISGLVSENYKQLNQLDSALYYINLQKDFLTDGHSYWGKFYESKGDLALEKDSLTVSLVNYTKALQYAEERWQGKPHSELSAIQNKIGRVFIEKGEYENAIKSFSMAKQIVNSLPDKQTIANQYLFYQSIVNQIIAQNNANQPFDAVKYVHEAISVLDYIKTDYKNTDDQLHLLEESRTLFENSLDVYANLYDKTTNAEYIDTMFYLIEKSKNNVLLSALNQSQANQFSGIPENVISYENKLKEKMVLLEQQLAQQDKDNDYLQQTLFFTKREYHAHLQRLEKEYKKYYNLKYNTSVVSLTGLQEKLKKDELALSFYYGKEHVYIIYLSKKNKACLKVQRTPSLDSLITQTYHELSNADSDIKELNHSTHELYQIMVKPIIKIEDNLHHLRLFPDGLLNYIPFEALSTNGNEHFLLQDYTVTYANSATLLSHLKPKRVKQSVLGIAPGFSSSNDFSALPNSDNEVKSVVHLLGGETILNEHATKEHFKKNAQNFSILHLATHAVQNDEFPNQSFLAFTNQAKNDNLLYVNEIYNLNLSNTAMVTLSACETGIGKLHQGEGFIGLSRAFSYSGAPAITSTLWQINDGSTTEIMELYYTHLSKGMAKDEALARAKRQFLESNEHTNLQHPYYWSAFIFSGNTTALTNKHSVLLYGIFSLILVVFIILFLMNKRAKNAPN